MSLHWDISDSFWWFFRILTVWLNSWLFNKPLPLHPVAQNVETLIRYIHGRLIDVLALFPNKLFLANFCFVFQNDFLVANANDQLLIVITDICCFIGKFILFSWWYDQIFPHILLFDLRLARGVFTLFDHLCVWTTNSGTCCTCFQIWGLTSDATKPYLYSPGYDIFCSFKLIHVILFRDTNLMYLNTVYCLGHMGVELADVPHTQELVLQFLQQNLNPSKLLPELEVSTLEQLGCMVIAGCVSYTSWLVDAVGWSFSLLSVLRWSIEQVIGQCSQVHTDFPWNKSVFR